MSKLDELIQELCPNGVEYKTLDEVAHYAKDRIPASNVDENTYVGVENLLQNKKGKTHATAVPTTGNIIAYKQGDILIGNIRPYLRKVWLADCNGGTNGDVLAVQLNETGKLEPRFLYYVLSSEAFFQYDIQNSKGAKMPRGSKEAVMKYSIPVPPLPVQSEIVRILDNFTKLTVELTAELTARQKQYECYRDKLLNFSDEIPTVQLADIADIGTGSSNTNEGLNEGKYPFFVRSQEPIRKNEYEFDETAIITAGDGIGVGKVFHYVEGKYALHQRAYRIHINTPTVYPKYFFYYMKSAFLPYIEKTMFQGSVPSIRRPMLNAFPVPVPTLDVQKRLVNVLDNFDAICTDLNIGLPAEIEARQKQYEYYRDTLLTFAEIGPTILSDQIRSDQIRSDQIRSDQIRSDEINGLIRLCQYVFGYVSVELGYIGKVSMCKRIMKAETSSDGDVPFFKIGTFGKEPDAYISREKFEEYKATYSYPNKGDILISAAGTIGRTVVFDGEDAYYQDSNIVWIANNENIVLNRYLYYCYQLQPWNVSTGGTIARLYNDNISKARIFVPSIKEQERIVSILDRFDTLCNDLSSGLPAEIEARQKQYEYYRDKLLTFKEQ
jgi:type I restriction enzyme S subunit